MRPDSNRPNHSEMRNEMRSEGRGEGEEKEEKEEKRYKNDWRRLNNQRKGQRRCHLQADVGCLSERDRNRCVGTENERGGEQEKRREGFE